jgi:hypothetical protein
MLPAITRTLSMKVSKKKLDYLPLAILFSMAVYLLWSFFFERILPGWQHILGLLMLPIVTIIITKKHKVGVLALGFALFLGLLGLASLSPAISTAYFGLKGITLLRFEPFFLLIIVLHFLVSGRYYVGILSKRYWENIRSDEPFKID